MNDEKVENNVKIEGIVLNQNNELEDEASSLMEEYTYDEYSSTSNQDQGYFEDNIDEINSENSDDIRNREIEDALEEIKNFQFDDLISKKEAEKESLNFDSVANERDVEKEFNSYDNDPIVNTIDQTVKELLMNEDGDELTRGKRAFLKKCEEFDFYRIPIHFVLENIFMTEINLSNAELNDQAVISISECIKECPTVQKLCLDKNCITPVGGEYLLNSLTKIKSIEYLDLSYNKLGDKGCKVQIGKSLSLLLQKSNSLKYLYLRNNHLGDRHLISIGEALQDNSVLREVDLGYNELGLLSGIEISKILLNNIELKKLNLEWNSLLNQGTVHVFNGLKNNNVLKYLNLSWNGVMDKGANEIGTVLYGNTSLEEFNLSHNRISKEGATKIALGIKENTGLKILNLSNNPLQAQGAKTIIENLRENQSITFLDLQNTKCNATDGSLPKELNDAIYETMKRRANLKPILL